MSSSSADRSPSLSRCSSRVTSDMAASPRTDVTWRGKSCFRARTNPRQHPYRSLGLHAELPGLCPKRSGIPFFQTKGGEVMLRKSDAVLTLATCAIAASAVFLVSRAAALDADPGIMTADNASGQLRSFITRGALDL